MSLKWRIGDRRLPPMDDGELVMGIEKYKIISRSLWQELDLPLDRLAVELKSGGLAKRLLVLIHGTCTAPALPPEPLVSETNVQLKEEKPPGGIALESSDKEERPAKRRNVRKTTPQCVISMLTSPTVDELRSNDELGSSSCSGVPEEVSGEDAVPEPFSIWIDRTPEFPTGSGQFPMFVKDFLLSDLVIILALGVVKVILEHAEHGPITLVDAENSRSWEIFYRIKFPACRRAGNVSFEMTPLLRIFCLLLLFFLYFFKIKIVLW